MKEGPIGYKLSRGKGELLTGLWPDLRPYSWPLRSGSGSRSALRHGDPTHRYLRDIPAWQRGLLTGLWHGDPAYRCLSGILAWRRGSSGRSSARHPYPQVPQWHPRVAKGGFWTVFGTATLPTGTSETSSRGKGGFWTVFGTAPLPTGTSGSSSRGEEGLLAGLRHGDPAHRYLSGILAEPLWVGV